MKKQKINIVKYLPLSIFLILSIGMVLLSPILKKELQRDSYFKQDFVDAKVVEIIEENIEINEKFRGRYKGKQRVLLGLLEGKHKHEAYEIDNILSDSHYVYVKKGDIVIASVTEKPEGPSVWMYNYKRDNVLIAMTVLFLLLLIVLGRKQGVYSILSLMFTGIVIVFLMMPLIFSGHSPILVSIISVVFITIVSFLLISGVTKKSLIAILGTTAGVIVAGGLSYVFGKLTMLSGYNMEHGQELVRMLTGHNVQVRGLLFAAILIASLGAVMDVSMSIVSAMIEVATVKPQISPKELFTSGITVGRDIMGTMSNTLILAFVGSSLNTIMLLWGYQMSTKQMMNIPFLGVEIVQGIAGSVGVILTVPLTAIIATKVIKRSKNIK